jgi:hypothetical protein
VNGFTASNYSATADLQNSQIITAPAKLFFQPAVSSQAVPWQRLLTVEILELHAPRSYLHSFPCRPQLNSTQHCPLLITARHGPHRKHHSFIFAFVSFVAGTCLPSSCPETVAARTTENIVPLSLRACMFRAIHSNCRRLQSVRLATGLRAKILSFLINYGY